jgi:hypothetical protein
MSDKTLYQMDNLPLGITGKVILNSKGMFTAIYGFDGKMISYRSCLNVLEGEAYLKKTMSNII